MLPATSGMPLRSSLLTPSLRAAVVALALVLAMHLYLLGGVSLPSLWPSQPAGEALSLHMTAIQPPATHTAPAPATPPQAANPPPAPRTPTTATTTTTTTATTPAPPPLTNTEPPPGNAEPIASPAAEASAPEPAANGVSAAASTRPGTAHRAHSAAKPGKL